MFLFDTGHLCDSVRRGGGKGAGTRCSPRRRAPRPGHRRRWLRGRYRCRASMSPHVAGGDDRARVGWARGSGGGTRRRRRRPRGKGGGGSAVALRCGVRRWGNGVRHQYHPRRPGIPGARVPRAPLGKGGAGGAAPSGTDPENGRPCAGTSKDEMFMMCLAHTLVFTGNLIFSMVYFL